MKNLSINSARMLADLDQLRHFGEQGKGVARRAFSDPDIASRQWLIERIHAAGLQPVVDACGNVFGLPPGDEPCLLIGSHSDTQPLGGWLDGAWGVICGLELARSAMEQGIPRVAMVAFQDEEGRFGRLTGSSVWAGQLSLAEADQCYDNDASVDPISFAQARQRVNELGFLGEVSPKRFIGFLEPHIEQGPVLDTYAESVGIVDSIVGVRQWHMRFIGESNHAGTTPMHLRRDALQGYIAFAAKLNEVFADLVSERTVWTLGRVVVEPNADSVVPGAVSFSVQMRDPENDLLDSLAQQAQQLAQEVAAARNLAFECQAGMRIDPVWMHKSWTALLEQAAEELCWGHWRTLPSGALHDASNLSEIMPTVMLFAPSMKGLSHNPNEDTRREDLAQAMDVVALGASKILQAV